MIVTGGKIYDQCYYCHKYIKLNGFFGGLHICLTPEERKQVASQAMMNQQNASIKMPRDWQKMMGLIDAATPTSSPDKAAPTPNKTGRSK